MPSTFILELREDRPNKRGECPVRLKITCNKKRKYYNTGFWIESKQWNKDKEKVRGNHPNYHKLNDGLDQILETAKEAARTLRLDNRESAQAIKDRLVGASNDNFFTLAEEHVEELRVNKQFYQRKQTKATIKKLKEFNRSESLLFTEINSDYLTRFQQFMKKKGNQGSTIRKNLGDIRRIIDIAYKRRLIFHDPFKEFEPIAIQKPAYKPKLTLEEIKAMEELDLEKGSNIWDARNCFILSFYFCGMRFGDLCTLTWRNVEGETLEYQMSKTGNNINIHIPDGAYPVLDRYKLEKKDLDEYVLPFCKRLEKEDRKDSMKVKQVVSSWNANINSCLKEVAKKASITKSISMHVARHSFAQFMASKEVSKYDMMILLGHTSIKTTENYLDTINVKVGQDTIRRIF